MNIRRIVAALAALALANLYAEGRPRMETLGEQFSYDMGMNTGEAMAGRYSGIELDLLISGIRDAVRGDILLTKAESLQAFNAYKTQQGRSQAKNRTELGRKNLETGKAFIKQNRSKEGVIILASGLQYKAAHAGGGASPKPDQTVTTHYRGAGAVIGPNAPSFSTSSCWKSSSPA